VAKPPTVPAGFGTVRGNRLCLPAANFTPSFEASPKTRAHIPQAHTRARAAASAATSLSFRVSGQGCSPHHAAPV